MTQMAERGAECRLYYNDSRRWAELIRYTIALGASFFNTQRMLTEYVVYAYRAP